MSNDHQTIGGYLRAARRRRRISIERAAEDTRIRPDYLMRMESDDFDFLAPTYVRGFLRSYASYLRVEPAPLLEELGRRQGTRTEVASVQALERHGKKQLAGAPRKLSSWTVAAIAAASLIVLLAIVGMLQGEDRPTPPSTGEVAATDAATPTPDPSPAPDEGEDVEPNETPDPNEDVAFDEGITLKIVATTADCWVLVSEDGNTVNPGGETITVGDSRTFSADERMFVRLGFPAGVELIVNGTNIGSPGGENPIDLRFPEDIDTLQ